MSVLLAGWLAGGDAECVCARSVPDPDEVLAELFRYGGRLLGHYGVLVHADDQGWKKTQNQNLSNQIILLRCYKSIRPGYFFTTGLIHQFS